jgi:hypothetical protein
MKKIKITLLFILVSVGYIFAQSEDDVKMDYRRSSLHLIMMEFDNYAENRAEYKKCFNLVPFPDKYNNHSISERYFNYQNFQTYTDNTFSGKNADFFNIESSIAEFFDENKIANKMVAKWFMRDPITGDFSMELIQERGMYGANELDKDIANNTIRGKSMLADAGEELIANTFIVVCRVEYIGKAELSKSITDGIKESADEANDGSAAGELTSYMMNLSADIFHNITKDGYEVKTEAFLYKLVWNEEIANQFFTNYWINKGEINEERKLKFDKSYLFELEYVGMESAVGKVLFSSKNKTPERIIEIATVRNINNVFTKLQKEYDVFKTKTPLITIDPLAAEIGLKEGLEKGDKYEILEAKMDEETGKVFYNVKGTTEVGNEIWDNRYGADEEPDFKSPQNKFTIFKGSGKYYPGLLLRQIK